MDLLSHCRGQEASDKRIDEVTEEHLKVRSRLVPMKTPAVLPMPSIIKIPSHHTESPRRKPSGEFPVGHRLDGAFAEYVIVPNPVLDTTLFHIPESMSWEVGATVEPVSAACFFVDRARIREGETVVVLGAGMIGQTVAQVCKAAAAARVIVSEPSPGRLQKAAALGADETLNPLETNPVEAVAKATAGRMADVVFECSGVPIAFHQGLQMLRFSGRMMQVAYFEKTLELPRDIMTLVVDKSLMLRGCAGQTWDKALELVRTEQINTKDLITHRFPLDSIKEAFEAHVNADQAIKVMVTP
jgi:L-iditol 2-dehydrogenase